MDGIVKNRERVDLLGIKIDVFKLPELLGKIDDLISRGQRSRVMYVNIHCMNTARRDKDYEAILNSADIVYGDGAGIVLGAKMLGQYLPERMTGADWIYDLCELAERKKYALYFLGGEPGVSERAQKRLEEKFPNLNVAGTHSGFLREEDNELVIKDINEKKPDILLVGMGTPIQEKWIAKNHDRLQVSITWAVGALFDYVAGVVPRAPRWMLKSGMEWTYRLWLEPLRMWKRYIIGNPAFLWQVFKERRHRRAF